MSKIGLIAILLLCGCKHAPPPQEIYSGFGPRPGYPCVIKKNSISDCKIDGGKVVSVVVECDPENPFVMCPAPKCRDCDCDKPERRNAKECRQLRVDIESYRKDCLGFLHGTWKDGVCDTGSKSLTVKP